MFRMKKYRPVLAALAAYGVLLLLSFQCSILNGYGWEESQHSPASSWLYARRILLIAAAVFLPWLTGSKGLTAYGWRITPRWLGISAVLGIVIGLGNRGGFDPRHASALLLACFHAFATELFFRAYLITTLSGVFRGFWMPVVISSVLYGVFYMTVWTAWNQTPRNRVIFIALFSLIGLVHGYCYRKSRSFPVPWLMHFLGVLRYRLLF